MIKRGGGVEAVRTRKLSSSCIVIELLVNVCESMGANIVNTLAEMTAPKVQELIGEGRYGLRILSNLCTERLTYSSFKIPVRLLDWKGVPGLQVAKRIVEGQNFAELDQYRATTHNKGIMNGIDAVAIATG